MILGNIGSESKMDYTSIGDIVNIASRIETLTKLYQTDILVTSELVDNLQFDHNSRFVDEVRVRGKQESVRLYEIFDHLNDDEKEIRQSNVIPLKEGFTYYKEGEFQKAIDIFKMIIDQKKKDSLPLLFANRSINMLRNENKEKRENWDGIFTIEEISK